MDSAMKLAYGAVSYASFPAWLPAYPLEETIKRLAGIGYGGIEIVAAAPHAWPEYMSKERRLSIRRCLESHSMQVSAMLPAFGGGPGNNPASADPAERRNAVEQYKQIADLSGEWGGKILVYPPGWRIFGTSRRDAWRWACETLHHVAEIAAQHQLTVVVEPTPADFNVVETADDAIQMMEDVSRSNVELMFDTHHVLYRNEVMIDYVYQMARHLRYIHISDNDRLPPGQGRGDFPALIAALREIGYEGYLTMEIGFFRRSPEPDQLARLAFTYLKALLDSSEVASRSVAKAGSRKRMDANPC